MFPGDAIGEDPAKDEPASPEILVEGIESCDSIVVADIPLTSKFVVSVLPEFPLRFGLVPVCWDVADSPAPEDPALWDTMPVPDASNGVASPELEGLPLSSDGSAPPKVAEAPGCGDKVPPRLCGRLALDD